MQEHVSHILIVDDDPSVREALVMVLRDRHIVHAVSTGAEALAIPRENPISAIILDEVLVGEHGLDLAPTFRAMTFAPILILTGYSTEELAIRAVHAGVDGYLKKPMKLQVTV